MQKEIFCCVHLTLDDGESDSSICEVSNLWVFNFHKTNFENQKYSVSRLKKKSYLVFPGKYHWKINRIEIIFGTTNSEIQKCFSWGAWRAYDKRIDWNCIYLLNYFCIINKFECTHAFKSMFRMCFHFRQNKILKVAWMWRDRLCFWYLH